MAEGGAHEDRAPRGRVVALDKKAKAAPAAEYLVATPVSDLRRSLVSASAVGWFLVGLMLLWEVVQYARFASEAAGFLEAAEGALLALQGEAVAAVQRGEDGGAGEGFEAAVRQELSQRLLGIYTRNRFLWPLSALLRW